MKSLHSSDVMSIKPHNNRMQSDHTNRYALCEDGDTIKLFKLINFLRVG